VDAVLSADVGDAPMRRRQYTALVHGAFCVTVGVIIATSRKTRRTPTVRLKADTTARGG
jgi:hypothetical protein